MIKLGWENDRGGWYIKILYKFCETLESEIGKLTNLTTTSKTSIVSAINELVTKIGNLTNLTTKNKSNIVSAINEIDYQLHHAFSYETDITTQVDDLTKFFVVGYDLSYGHEATSGIPFNANAFIIALHFSDSYIVLMTMSSNNGATYRKVKHNGTWEAEWTKIIN